MSDKPTKMSKEQIQAIKDMSWSDYDKELVDAYAEAEEEMGKKEQEEVSLDTAEWKDFMRTYAEHRSNKLNDFGIKDGTRPDQGEVKITVKEFSIGLPDSLDKLDPKSYQDLYYYMPEELREFIVHHDYMIELLSGFLPDYIMQPELNEFETLKYLMEYSYSYGLTFRKMYCIKGSYCCIFFTFTSRTNDTLIEDFKSNSNIMMYEEAIVIEKNINEMEKRKAADARITDGSISLLTGEESSSIKIKGGETIISYQEATEYIYSSLTVMVFYELDKKTIPSRIVEDSAMIIRWEKYPDIRCKFHHLYILPST